MARKTRFFGGALLVAGFVTVAAGSVGSGSARAATPTPVCSAGSCTVTFSASDTWIVPAGVNSAKFDVKGAGGGAGGGGAGACASGHLGGAGGSGDEVSATVIVTPSQSYALTVGQAGTAGECSGANGTGGVGGVNGGDGGAGDTSDANAGGGGGGGGASSVGPGPIIVAAGGGGGGGGGHLDAGTAAGHGTLSTSSGASAAPSSTSGGGGGGGGGQPAGAGGAVGATGSGGAGGNSGSDSGAGTYTTTPAGGGAAGINGSITVTYSGLVPVMDTAAATDVTATTATLNGSDPNYTFSGETYYFEYSTSSTFATSTKTTAATPASGTLSAALTGLAQGTKYYYRIVSAAGGPDPTSPPRTFTTFTYPATGAATRVTINSATISGTDPNYNISGGDTYYFEYGATPSFGAKAPTTPVAATSETVSTPLTNLKPSTIYYYKIVSTDAGPDQGTTHYFTTFSYSADIHLTGPSHAKLGKKLTYEATFLNSGTGTIPLPLADVTLKGAKHQKLKILSASGCSQHGNSLGCRFGKSAATGQSVTRTFVIKVTGKPGTLTMSGVVVSIGTLTDPSAHSTAKLSTKLTR